MLRSSRVNVYQVKSSIRCHPYTDFSTKKPRDFYVRSIYGFQMKMRWYRTINAHTRKTKVLHSISTTGSLTFHANYDLGAEKAGTIVADMGPLVKSGKIPLIKPPAGYVWKPHYKIEFELVMIINGRNLRFEARWPKGGEVQGSTQICIAAAFRPGTD